MSRRSETRAWSAALLLATAALGGCGNLTAGGFGEADVIVSGDAPDPAVAPDLGGGPNPLSTVFAGPESVPAQANEADEIDPEGELHLTFQLFLRRADGSEFALSDDDLQAELDLSGDIEADVVRARVPADAYPELRVLFRKIEVEVDRGVVIGGQEVVGPVDVEVKDLEVVRAIDLEVRENGIVQVLLDLNAATWIALVDPELRTVDAADFAEAFAIRVQ